MGALAELDPYAVLAGDALFTEFKGALTEQYVHQQLISQPASPTPYYWSKGAGRAEVDFVTTVGLHVVPIEVKAERNLNAKSLRVYRSEYGPDVAIRTSLAPYHKGDGLIDLPLYALNRLSEEVDAYSA
jgi:predicted AAA+ superfamily ATPase